LFQKLVKEKQLFSSIDCYHFGSTDPGLMSIEGKLVKGINIRDAEQALMDELRFLQEEGISEAELEKVKNKAERAASMAVIQKMSQEAIRVAKEYPRKFWEI
jgi:hypothetical protein